MGQLFSSIKVCTYVHNYVGFIVISVVLHDVEVIIMKLQYIRISICIFDVYYTIPFVCICRGIHMCHHLYYSVKM
jgi:hypothetical protein